AKQLAELARQGGDLATAGKYEAEHKRLLALGAPKRPAPLHPRVQQQYAIVSRLEKVLGKEADKLVGWRSDLLVREGTVRSMRAELEEADALYKSLVTELQQQASVGQPPGAPTGPAGLKLEDFRGESFDLGAVLTIDEVSFFEGDDQLDPEGREGIAERKGDPNAGVSKLAADLLGPLVAAVKGLLQEEKKNQCLFKIRHQLKELVLK
ncbi:unnamed protein product, partial [Prorocentrum cordatum]